MGIGTEWQPSIMRKKASMTVADRLPERDYLPHAIRPIFIECSFKKVD